MAVGMRVVVVDGQMFESQLWIGSVAYLSHGAGKAAGLNCHTVITFILFNRFKKAHHHIVPSHCCNWSQVSLSARSDASMYFQRSPSGQFPAG